MTSEVVAPAAGRPRSERARQAVLEAVDDLLAEVGYATMTMKGIAERAGVGRQTVYRWWSTKAEILLEACIVDAHEELSTPAQGQPLEEVACYLRALEAFLASPAGVAYRALLGEAQHDAAVAELLRGTDVLAPSAGAVVARLRRLGAVASGRVTRLAVAELVGPSLYRALVPAHTATPADVTAQARDLLHAWSV